MILVTGAGGFLGSAVCAELRRHGRTFVALGGREDCDLRQSGNLTTALAGFDRATVIHCAYPGTNGIGTMLETGADLVHDLLQIDLNVIDVCAKAKVKKLICVGSVCAYPEDVTYPVDESQLWNGYPEAVNAPYGIAKRMQLELLKVYRRQYGLNGVHLILGNLYGPGDRSGHVIPATIGKVLKAKAEGASEVEVWGDGTATREFLYVEDAARAIVAALTAETGSAPINVCSGYEVSIRDLTLQIMEACDYQGAIRWDHSKPNGQPRRWFARRRALIELGWVPTVPFPQGLASMIAWMREETTYAAHD